MKCGRLGVVVVLLGLIAAPSAMAWDYVGVGVSVGRSYCYDPVVVERVYAPPVVTYVEPAVTYVAPAVTYVEPAPVVVAAPVYSRTVIYDRPRVVARAYGVPCHSSVVVAPRYYHRPNVVVGGHYYGGGASVNFSYSHGRGGHGGRHH